MWYLPDSPKFKSLCPKCSKSISNQEYFKGRNGSVHFNGTCKPDTFFPGKIPVQSWKSPLPYPHVKSNPCPKAMAISTMAELCEYWGVPMIGDNDINAKIAALLEEQNRLLAILKAA